MAIMGKDLFVKALKAENVDLVFGYPGGMVVDLFDALYEEDDIELVLPRHEQALVHEADGYARSTGKVGVCLVTSGPGATNLVTGIATANYDSVPLVCFTGQVATNLIGNDAFQEVDIVGICRNICKYAITVTDRQELAEVIKKAFYVARTGKPGPVLIDIPIDIQKEMGEEEYPEEINIRSYKPSTGVHIGQLKRAMKVLQNAAKPVILAGGGVNLAQGQKFLSQVSTTMDIPVITTIMGKGAVPYDHPNYVGNIGMYGNYASNHAITDCDVLFSIGTRFNDRITGTISEFAKNATIIHVDIDSASISRNIKVDIPIVADARETLELMAEHAKEHKHSDWMDQIREWKKEYPINMDEYEGMTPQKIINKINDLFPGFIIVTDVGQNQLWTTQYINLDENRQMLTSGGLGTMGYGIPAAIGAKLGNPDKTVICISGDGGVQMNIQEMATAVSMELPMILCIMNNGYLGNVRQMQEMFFDHNYAATCLNRRRSCPKICNGPSKNCPKYTPDFVKLAESYGAHGIRVEKEGDIEQAFKEAASYTDAPTIVEFIIEREANVWPMVPGGKALTDMVMEVES